MSFFTKKFSLDFKFCSNCLVFFVLALVKINLMPMEELHVKCEAPLVACTKCALVTYYHFNNTIHQGLKEKNSFQRNLTKKLCLYLMFSGLSEKRCVNETKMNFRNSIK